MISFTIADTTYQAEEGMTWGEWVNSEYNTGGFKIWNGFIGYGQNEIVRYSYNGDSAYVNMTIESYQYVLASGGAAN